MVDYDCYPYQNDLGRSEQMSAGIGEKLMQVKTPCRLCKFQCSLGYPNCYFFPGMTIWSDHLGHWIEAPRKRHFQGMIRNGAGKECVQFVKASLWRRLVVCWKTWNRKR